MRVGLRDEAAQPARQHALQPPLLGKTAAQHHRHLGVDLDQFRENVRAIHDRHREIEDDERDLVAQLAVHLDRLETIARRDHAVALVAQHALREHGDEILVIHDHHQLPRAGGIVDAHIARQRRHQRPAGRRRRQRRHLGQRRGLHGRQRAEPGSARAPHALRHAPGDLGGALQPIAEDGEILFRLLRLRGERLDHLPGFGNDLQQVVQFVGGRLDPGDVIGVQHEVG